MRIRDIVSAKDSTMWSRSSPSATVRDLLELLAEHNIGALVVSTDGAAGRRASSPSATSCAACTRDEQRAGARGRDDHDHHGAHLRARTDLDDLMALMTERRIRHVPVVEDGGLIGIVSIGDVVKHKMSDLQFERDQLDSYVHQT